MSSDDDASAGSDSSLSAAFSFGMTEYKDFDSDSEDEGQEVVFEYDPENVQDLWVPENDIVDEMAQLTLHTEGIDNGENEQNMSSSSSNTNARQQNQNYEQPNNSYQSK